MDSNQLLMFSTSKKPELKKESTAGGHYSKAKRSTTYRSQPYDRSSPSTSRSSTGTPPSSPDQNCGELDVKNQASNPVVCKEQKKHRREEANKRERTRMHTVNSAFDHLRQLVPTYPSNRKLSKIETLRLACSYIQDLTKLVNDHNIQAMHGEDVNLLYRPELDGGSYGNGGPPHYSTSTNSQTAGAGGYMNPMTAPAPISTSSKADFSSPAPAGTEFTTTSQQHTAVGNYYHPTSTMTSAGTTMGYVNSDPESQSESDIPSPSTCHYSNMFVTPTPPPVPTGIAVRPPPAISRVGSDTIIAMQMANASISSSSPTYCGSPGAGAPCSPLTRAQHSSASITHSQITSTLQCNPSPLSSIQPSFTSIHAPIFPQCYSQ